MPHVIVAPAQHLQLHLFSSSLPVDNKNGNLSTVHSARKSPYTCVRQDSGCVDYDPTPSFLAVIPARGLKARLTYVLCEQQFIAGSPQDQPQCGRG